MSKNKKRRYTQDEIEGCFIDDYGPLLTIILGIIAIIAMFVFGERLQ